MPTAILVIYTNEGFAAISDGRAMGTDGRVNSQKEQKIFPIRSSSCSLVFGVAGTASLLDKAPKWDNKPRKDVFKQIYCDLIKRLPAQSFTSLGQYADSFVAAAKGQIFPYLNDTVFKSKSNLKMIFAGYFKRVPSTSERTISIGWNFFSTIAGIDHRPAQIHEPCVVDSPKITDRLLHTHDFAQFETTGFRKIYEGDPSLSLSEAIEAGKRYIDTCETQKARDLDEYCKTIGGDKSVATITSAEGFKWIEPPVCPYLL